MAFGDFFFKENKYITFFCIAWAGAITPCEYGIFYTLGSFFALFSIFYIIKRAFQWARKVV